MTDSQDFEQAFLYQILRFALKATQQSKAQDVWSTTQSKDRPRAQDPRFRKLVQGILFSRQFILSYQLVLLGLLLVFTVRHWGLRLQSWRIRRRRSRAERERGATSDSSNPASSSSSTFWGSNVSTPKDENQEAGGERTPLLPLKSNPESKSQQPTWRKTLKAWLTYQPRPIPIINKTLPSNSISLAVVTLWVLQIFYTFYHTPLSISLLFVFADRTSLVFVANLPLLYLFAAKNQPIKVLTGYSYEALNIFHRRLGEVMCLLALLHSAGMIGVWYTILRPTGFSLARFLFSKIILLGLGAFIAYELIYFTSLGSFRQRWYELFLGLHIVLQAAALVFVWFHHHNSRPYVGAAFAIYFIDRIVYRILLKRKSLRATLQTTEDGGTVILRADVPQPRGRFPYLTFGKRNIHLGWRPTEHIFLSMPALAPEHIIQAHPFTIASKAPSAIWSSSSDTQELKLIIRAQDGFSKDMVHYSKTHNTARIHIDGPYGSQNAVNLLRDSDTSIVIAGGSGIAVAWPLIWSLISSLSLSDDDEENPEMSLSLQTQKNRRILFIWVIREASHLSWLEPNALQSLTDCGVEVFIPPPTSKCGHPDLKKIVEEWVRKSSSVGDDKRRGKERIGLVCSGPDGMNRSIRNVGADTIRRGYDLDVEIEKFGW